MRLAIGKTFAVVAKVLQGTLIEDPGVMDAKSTRPSGVQLQAKAPIGDDIAIHVGGIDEEGMTHSRGPYSASKGYASWVGCIVWHHR